jgi:hypothetical protein
MAKSSRSARKMEDPQIKNAVEWFIGKQEKSGL